MRPAPGVKVSQISSLDKDIARAVGHQRARGGRDPGQVGHGPGDPEREARDRHSRRDPPVEGVRRSGLAADAGARQGHRRRAACARISRKMPHLLVAGTTGSGKSVAHQRHGAVAALQEHRQARAHDDDRPEDARAVGLRGHSAPARARGHRHEASRQRPALVRGRDGAPLQADVGARRAQHCRLQPQGEGRHRRRQADDGSADDGRRGNDPSIDQRLHPGLGRCRTSSCSSTSSPT